LKSFSTPPITSTPKAKPVVKFEISLFITATSTPGHYCHFSAPSTEVTIVATLAESVTVSIVEVPDEVEDSLVVVQSETSARQGHAAEQS